MTTGEELLDEYLNEEYADSIRFEGKVVIAEVSYNNIGLFRSLFSNVRADSVTIYTDIILVPGFSGIGYNDLLNIYNTMFAWLDTYTRRINIISHRSDMLGHSIVVTRNELSISLIIVGSMSNNRPGAPYVETSTHQGIGFNVVEIVSEPHILLYQHKSDECIFVTYKPLIRRLGCM